MLIIKNKYSEYCNPQGSYRKYLMKQQSANTAEMYDYFSRLEVRCRQLMRCNELSQASAPFINRMLVSIGEFISDMRGLATKVFEQEGDNLHKIFADSYDEAASVVEGFELEASKYLGKMTNLSEDAQLIQRRTHFQKNHAKNGQKSLAAKMAWRTHKGNMVAGIEKFHKSSAGKQFHRNLARFSRRGVAEQFNQDDIMMTAKGLSSCCTHILIEIQNYFTDNAGKINEKVMADAASMRELFHIFSEALSCTLDAYFEDDKDSIANVVDIIKDFYDIYGAGDKQIPDTAGVDTEVNP
jgi:hypothetical protein